MKTQEEFNHLDIAKKIIELSEQASNLLPLLQKDISELNETDLQNLYEFSNFEYIAKQFSTKLSQDLLTIIQTLPESIEENIKSLLLTDAEAGIIDNIYKKTIVAGIHKGSDSLFNSFKEGKGVIYNVVLCEQVVNILESILDFKKQIDQRFPGLTDVVISVAAPVLVGIVSAYAPPIGLALKATGIIDKVASFLQTETLEKTIGKMQNDLAAIEQDKQLKQIKETGIKLSELSKEFNISPTGLNLLGINHQTVDTLIKEVSSNKESGHLLKLVCEYAERHVPSNKETMDKTLSAIKEKTLDSLKTNGASKEVIAAVEIALSEGMADARKEMKKTLKSDTKIFDKIISLQKTADILSMAENKIMRSVGKQFPDSAKSLKTASEILQQEVMSKVRGNTAPIISPLTPTPPE